MQPGSKPDRAAHRRSIVLGALVLSSITLGQRCLGVPPREVAEEMLNQKSTTSGSSDVKSEKDRTIGLTLETSDPMDKESGSRADLPWLGVSTTEASETLAAQLGLPPGVGLVISYIAHDSPAAKAGLQKHDVLVGFEQQSLVHPAQLRKLVRVHQVGDKVKIEFYHAGHRQSTSVTLGKLAGQMGSPGDGSPELQEQLRELQGKMKDLHLDVVIRDQVNAARDALSNLKLDQKVQQDIRLGMDEARKALRDALRNSTNSDSALRPLRQILDDLAGTSVVVGSNATVTVRSSAHSGSRSLVNTDDSGTVVLVANPKLHLTAHDGQGHLVFDGEIETAEQRDRVPRDLWTRVEPLLDKLNANQPEEPEAKDSK